jgi:hypothetical protein
MGIAAGLEGGVGGGGKHGILGKRVSRWLGC